MRHRLVIRTLLLVVLVLPLAAQKKGKEEPPPFAGTKKEFTDVPLSITFPDGFTDLGEVARPIEYLKQAWTAKIGAVDLDVTLWVVPLDKFQFTDPEDVLDLRLDNVREQKGGDPSFSFAELELVSGSFGIPGYASLGYGGFHDATEEVATFYYLGGMLEKQAYSLEVRATPKPGPDGHKLILEFLKRGVAFKGKARDPKWSEAEVVDRWKKDAPDSLAKEKVDKVIRTAHYIVFTNSSGGKKFAEQMETNYEKIKQVYPFEDSPGQRLMPVFLFRNPEEYYAFFAKQFKRSLDEARRSKGVAYMDWYATYYEAPGDTVHIHEGTHQIFKNRLRLAGGGSWFQEGVAEYMSELRNDLNNAARLVRKGEHMPLSEFVKVQSLLFSSKEDAKSGADAADQYAFAALLIEFLRESKFGKDKFQEFVHKVGLAARNDVPAIERCVQAAYKTDLAGLEKEWIEYCKKRK